MGANEFFLMYERHLSAVDRPTCRAAYNRAEFEYKVLFDRSRYRSWAVFRVAYSRFCRKRRLELRCSVDVVMC